jgi:translocation and assembly module TamB
MEVVDRAPARRFELMTGVSIAQIAPAVPNLRLGVPAQPAKSRYWTAHWSFEDVAIKTVFARLKTIGVEIPFKAVGYVSVDFDVSVPWNRLRDGKAYRFGGQLKSKRLQFENLLLEDFEAEVNYVDGVLELIDVKGRWTDVAETETAGSFEGTAQAQLLPRGDFRTEIVAHSLPLAPLHHILVADANGPTARSMRGTVDGRIRFQAPIERLTDASTWTLDADLNIDNFRLDHLLPLSTRTGPLQIRDGVIRADQIEITSPTSPDVRLDMALQVELTGRRRFTFRVRGNDVPLDGLSEIVVPDKGIAAGKLDIDAEGRGELASESWDIQGRLGSPKLTVLGQNLGLIEHAFKFNQRRLEFTAIDPDAAEHEQSILLKRVVANYALDQQSLRITDITARIFDGVLEGEATFARAEELNHSAKMSWRDLDFEFNAGPFVPRRIKIAATTTGRIDWTFQRGTLGLPRAHQGTVEMRLDQITMGKSKVGDLRLSMRASETAVQLAGDGKLFGGPLQLDTRTDLKAGDSWWKILENPAGDAVGKQMKLEMIARALQFDRRKRWAGTVSMHLQQRPADSPSAAGSLPTIAIGVQDAFVDGHTISRRLDLQLRMKGDTIVIDQISGNYAGGNIWVQGSWSLRHGQRRIHCRLTRVDARVALLPLMPIAASRVDGKVSGTLTLSGNDALRFGGAITARHSSFFSIPTGTVHAGVRGSLSPDFRSWKVTLNSIRGEVADGRITADAHFSSSHNHQRGFDLSSRWEVRRVNFGKLLAATGSSSRIANGNMTGSLTLGGRGIRNSSDLVGRFDARLGATQAAAVPGLVQADEFLGLASLAGVRFNTGKLEGAIASGAASIDEFWLRSGRVRVWSEGKIQLANQRMDLDVVISTGYLQSDQGQLLSLASQLAIQSVLPGAALVEVNRILNYRTIHLAFDGPVRDPRIRLKPMEIIRAEAARFLLRELLIAGSASSSLL